MTLFASHALATAIERSVARDLLLYAQKAAELEPDLDCATLSVAGGRAIWLAPNSPVNMAYGMGFAGPVSASEVKQVEEFFAERGARAAISLSPLADVSLPDVLARRGWVLTGYENVLALDLHEFRLPELPRGVEVERVETSDDRDVWTRVGAEAFTAPEEPGPEHMRLARVMAERRDMVLLVGTVSGAHAGTGALWVDGDLGWLLGDATLPAWRRRGVQSALQAARCALARDAGCRYAISEALPGSVSQANQERLGFRVLYTRVELTSPEL